MPEFAKKNDKKCLKNAFFIPFTINKVRFEYSGSILNEKSPEIFTNAYGQAARTFPVLVFENFPYE